MPTYTYRCDCSQIELVRPMAQSHVFPRCPRCRLDMRLVLQPTIFKFAGRVTPGGGPDRFTADMLGIPLKELPSGLKT